jgi:diguanylate cyclase (GGDEF)-like protein/PAS domain S-box-containing protein
MSSPVITVNKDTQLSMAALHMHQNQIRRLVVLDEDDNLCGVITESNFVRAMESKYVDTLKDIITNQGSQLAQAIRRLSAKNLYLDSILATSMGLGIVAADSNGLVELYNNEAQRILGLKADDVIGKQFHAIQAILGIDHHRCDGVLGTVQTRGSHSFSFERTGEEGKLFVQAMINGIWDAHVFTGYVMVLRDLTSNKKAEDTIKFLAYHDSLTNLPNRSSFHERITVELARAKRSGSVMAIMLLDLNRFKEVNDTLGHFAGDQLLKALAGRMQACLRESDSVTRFGGDEFIFILPEAGSRENAAFIAQNILQEIEQPLEIEGVALVPTASMGVVCYPLDGDAPDNLLRLADNAMYKAKDQSRTTNCSAVAFCP